jgi:hypothetical protein
MLLPLNVKLTVPANTPWPVAVEFTVTVALSLAVSLNCGAGLGELDNIDEVVAVPVLRMLNVCETGVAALYWLSPLWLAVTVHDPAAVMWILLETIEQLPDAL